MKIISKLLSFCLCAVLLIAGLTITVTPPHASAATITFSYNNSGDLVDNSGNYVIAVGSQKAFRVSNRYASIESNTWRTTDSNVVTLDYRGYSGQNRCDVIGKNVGVCTVTGTVVSFVLGASHYNPITRLFEFDDPTYATNRQSFGIRVVPSGKAVPGTYSGSSSSSSSANLSTPKITNFSSTDDGVKVTWGAVSGAEKYRLFYKNGKGNWVKIGDTTSTSLTDTVVSSGSTYTYTVRCLNSNATKYTSGYDSSGWKYTYNMGTPKATGLSSTSSGVKISWSSVSNAKKYRVFYKNSKGGWTKVGDTTGTSIIDEDVGYGKTYTYTIRCIKSDGSRYTSGYNSTGWKHTYSYKLSTPKINSSSSSSNGIKLSWNSVGADKYRVFYKNRKGGWTKLGDTTGTSITDSDVTYGKTYTYTVRAMNSSASRYTSDYDATGRKHTHYLDTPTVYGFESTSDGVMIKWNSVSGADRYRVFYKNSDGGWSRLGDTYGTSFLDEYVSAGTPYTYTVRCINSNATAYTSDYYSPGWTYAYSPYNEPSVDSAPVLETIMYDDEDDIYVWIDDNYEGATDFAVFVKEGSSWRKIGTVSDYKGWIFHYNHQLTSGRSYIFTVRGIDDNGNYITPFDSAGFKVTLLKPMEITGTNLGSGKARFSWDPVPGATQYTVQLTNDIGVNIGPIASTDTECEMDFSQFQSAKWTLKVIAFDDNISMSKASAININS